MDHINTASRPVSRLQPHTRVYKLMVDDAKHSNLAMTVYKERSKLGPKWISSSQSGRETGENERRKEWPPKLIWVWTPTHWDSYTGHVRGTKYFQQVQPGQRNTFRKWTVQRWEDKGSAYFTMPWCRWADLTGNWKARNSETGQKKKGWNMTDSGYLWS